MRAQTTITARNSLGTQDTQASFEFVTQSRNLPTTFLSFWACAALAKAFVGNEFGQSPPGCGLGWGGASPSTDS